MLTEKIAGKSANDKIIQMASEHMVCKMDAKMCEYIDRIGRHQSKDTDKRKNPASNIR